MRPLGVLGRLGGRGQRGVREGHQERERRARDQARRTLPAAPEPSGYRHLQRVWAIAVFVVIPSPHEPDEKNDAAYNWYDAN